MNKAVLFDLDGTLTDSGEGIIKCVRLALEHFGITGYTDQQLRVCVGPPLDESFRRFGIPDHRVDEAIAVYRSRYLTVGKYENYPYPGIREALQQLKDAGCRLFVATSKPEKVSVDILQKFELAHFFEIIAGATFDGSRSTKAQVIAYLLAQTGAVEDAVMVGDTAFDVLGAKAHGIGCIGVSWGYGQVEEMRQAGAVAIAHTMQELTGLILE